jgi:Beta/Gamma crystallin
MGNMKARVLFAVILGVAIGVAGPALFAQQERQFGGVGLTVFADRDFRGRTATIREDMPNLQAIGLNDLVSSLRVGRGEQWEVCEHANYAGRCVVVSGSEADLRDSGWNKMISSARRLRGGGGGFGPPVPPGRRGLELFSSDDFEGDRRVIMDSQPDLRRLGFNDAARSLRIGPRETWEVCDHIDFNDCRVVNSDFADLKSLGMSRRISSVRRVGQGGGGGGGRGNRGSIILYDARGYRGQSYRVERETEALSGFANRAQSVQVTGGSWELCDRAGFAGRCVVVSGDLPDLASLGLQNRVASIRPVPMPR